MSEDYLRKTETEIERDLFRLVKASPLYQEVRGKLYRRGMRPRNATTEDIVVTFISGEESQEQNGVINLNVYVPMITVGANTNKVQDLARVESLERLVLELI